MVAGIRLVIGRRSLVEEISYATVVWSVVLVIGWLSSESVLVVVGGDVCCRREEFQAGPPVNKHQWT